MKHINFSFVRFVIAVIIGLILVMWPDSASNYLVITLGVLFVIPGLLGFLDYFTGTKKSPRHFPIAGLGSFLFGLWLIIMPGFFANLLMFFLGGVLVIGGIQQLYAVTVARRWTTVSFGFYILPVLTLLAGLLVIVNPEGVRNAAFVIIGVTCLVYAVSELINWFRFTNRKSKRVATRNTVEDAKVLDD